MNKIFITCLVAILLVSTPALSTAAEKQVLAHESFSLEAAGGELEVEKYLLNDEVLVSIVTKSGEKLLDMGALGSEDKKFTDGEKTIGLAVKDLTGDGIPEVISSAYYGPASALYVFQFNPASKKFAPMKFIDSSDAELNRDFMVSDFPAADGEGMVILPDNSLKAIGKIYPSEPDKEVIPGTYLFRFDNGSFKLAETKPLEANKE